MSLGIKVTMLVCVVDKYNIKLTYLPEEEFICNVQPPPYCYDRPQVLETMSDALAKVAFINKFYTRLAKEEDLAVKLKGKEWDIAAFITKRQPLCNGTVLG